MPIPSDDDDAATYWDSVYDQPPGWSGRPNEALVREVAELPPGTALDVGCGSGGDAIWLAEQGWRVTAIDVSAKALAWARDHAEAAGVSDMITWERHDVERSLPSGPFDLVSAHFLHTPVAMSVESVLRTLRGLVGPGGHLLVVNHDGFPAWLDSPPADFHFPDVEEMVSTLELDSSWQVEVARTFHREVKDPSGAPAQRGDNVVLLTRRN